MNPEPATHRETPRARHEKPGSFDTLLDEHAAMLARRLLRISYMIEANDISNDPALSPSRRDYKLHHLRWAYRKAGGWK